MLRLKNITLKRVEKMQKDFSAAYPMMKIMFLGFNWPWNETGFVSCFQGIDAKAERKLLKAGANKTFFPNGTGGVQKASLILQPAEVSFLDLIVRAGNLLIDLEEVEVIKGSELVNKSLAEARIPERTELVVLAVKRPGDGTIIYREAAF